MELPKFFPPFIRIGLIDFVLVSRLRFGRLYLVIEVSPVFAHILSLRIILFDSGPTLADLLASAMRFVLPSSRVSPLVEHPFDHLFANDLAWLRERNGSTTVWAGNVKKPAILRPTVFTFKTVNQDKSSICELDLYLIGVCTASSLFARSSGSNLRPKWFLAMLVESAEARGQRLPA